METVDAADRHSQAIVETLAIVRLDPNSAGRHDRQICVQNRAIPVRLTLGIPVTAEKKQSNMTGMFRSSRRLGSPSAVQTHICDVSPMMMVVL
jgi:hypothetical protein